MKFRFQNKECDVEIFKNENGIVVQFYNAELEPREDKIVDYVFVDTGLGYISLKRKGEEGILSGLLKKEFFDNNSIVDYAIDFVENLLPNMKDAYIPYHLERIIIHDSMVYTGETYHGFKKE